LKYLQQPNHRANHSDSQDVPHSVCKTQKTIIYREKHIRSSVFGTGHMERIEGAKAEGL